jgi:hypothetical protein
MISFNLFIVKKFLEKSLLCYPVVLNFKPSIIAAAVFTHVRILHQLPWNVSNGKLI